MDLEQETESAFGLSGPLPPPPPDSPDGTSWTPSPARSSFDRLKSETKKFLTQRNQWLESALGLAATAGEFSDAADVRDYQQFTSSAARNVSEGNWAEAAKDAGYGVAAGMAAFVPGLGGIGSFRRAVEDPSLFRQNPEQGVSSTATIQVNPRIEKIKLENQGREATLKQEFAHVLDEGFFQELLPLTQKISKESRAGPIPEEDSKAYTDLMNLAFGKFEEKGLTYRGSDPDGFMEDSEWLRFENTLGRIRRGWKSYYNEVDLRPTIQSGQGNLQSFYNPIETSIETMPFDKNGVIKGSKAIEFMQNKGQVSGANFKYTGMDIDPNRTYSRSELQILYEDKAFDVIGYTDTPSFSSFQRQGSDQWGEIEDYQELLIDVVPAQTSSRSADSYGTHFSDQNLAHSRVSLRAAPEGATFLPPGEKYVLVEEIQSDAVQSSMEGRGVNSPFNTRPVKNSPDDSAVPVKGIGDTTRLSLLQTIMYAKENGSNFVVVPSVEDIAYAGRVQEGEKIPRGFEDTYKHAVKNALKRIQHETKGQVSFSISSTEKGSETDPWQKARTILRGVFISDVQSFQESVDRVFRQAGEVETADHFAVRGETDYGNLSTLEYSFTNGGLDGFLAELYGLDTIKDFNIVEDIINDFVSKFPPEKPRDQIIIDISNLDIDPTKTELRFNKGGLVPNMEDDTMEAFGGEADPISGNPVPPGGTPEGVRDDIPAKLSEGEFVIPAHVVRFIGVNTLMKLIEATEQQLGGMEQGGMMGQPVPPTSGDDLPFDPSTIEMEDVPDEDPMGGGEPLMGFSQGGLVNDQQPQIGYVQTQPAQTANVQIYRDRTGFLRFVPVVNGQPIGTPPAGSTPITNPQTGQPKPTGPAAPSPMVGQDGSDRSVQKDPDPSYDVNKLTAEQAEKFFGQQTALRESTAAKAGLAAASQIPGMGMVGLAQRPIHQALAGKVLEEKYGEEPTGIFGSLLGGTALGRAMGFSDRADALNTLSGANDRSPAESAPKKAPAPPRRPSGLPSAPTDRGNDPSNRDDLRGGDWSDPTGRAEPGSIY